MNGNRGVLVTFFSRRRIQSMICDLHSHLNQEKRKDIVNRLNSKEAEQCLGAEVELAIAWSLRNLDLDVEPFWWKGSRSPDIYVDAIVKDRPVAIEVTAFADAAISGEAQMDHCAQKLIAIADAEQRRSGQYLYFHFAETRNYQNGRNERGIAAPRDFYPSQETIQKVQSWIRSNPDPTVRLRIEDRNMIVELEKRTYKQIRYHNYHVSRPPRTYSEKRNPLYKRLADKAKQVEDAPSGVSRIVLLVEAGSRFLADITARNWQHGIESYSSAQDIIQRFITDKSDKIDAVIVFVPVVEYSSRLLGRHGPKNYWSTRVYCAEQSNTRWIEAAVESILRELPPPRFDGYNARSLIRQKAMQHDARGWYRVTSMTKINKKITYKISSRAFQDLREDGSTIGRLLNLGYTIQAVTFEAGGIDQDDDYIVLELNLDAAAAPFV
jgi:hypothetical protein